MTLRAKLVLLFAVATLVPVTLGGAAWWLLGRTGDVADDRSQVVERFKQQLHDQRLTYLRALTRAEGWLAGAPTADLPGVDYLWVVDATTERLVGNETHGLAAADGPALVTQAKGAGSKTFHIELGESEHQRVLASALYTGRPSPHWLIAGHRETRLAGLKRDLLRQGTVSSPSLWSWLVMLGAIAIAMSLLFADRASSWLRASLDDIAKAAERIGKGDLDATVPERGDSSFKATATAFNRMTSELRDAQERLRKTERIAAWQDIAKRLAHEIKNPLSPIQLSIETLRKARRSQHAEFDAIFDESTGAILDEVNRLRRITDEFGRFARLPSPNPSVVDIGELVAQVVGLYEDEGVRYFVPTGESLLSVADREQITQVLHNLLRNALEATKGLEPVGRIDVRLETAGERILVHVRDEGPGIPQEQRTKIFDPYFTTKEEGSGLGLAITDRIVTEHGGRIDVTTGTAGTTFTVSLPRQS